VVVTRTLCPYCHRVLESVGKTSDDHVVTKAVGGRVTVRTCKVCNDVSGSAIEGKLLSANGMMTFMAQHAGLRVRPLDGFGETGRYTADFRTMKFEPVPRVDVRAEGDRLQVDIVAAPHRTRKILRDLSRRYPAFPVPTYEQLTAEQREQAPTERINTDLVVELDVARRWLAKTALGTGAYIWGDSFTTAPLGDWLRQVLDIRRDWPDPELPQPDPEGDAWQTESTDVPGMLSALADVYARAPRPT
jgi:hypothetical protein